MNTRKRRFNRKKILGIVKTYHSKKRQVERDISDQKLIEVLQYGEVSERSEHEVIFELDGYHVYLSHDMERIVTVIGPEQNLANPKLIPRSKGEQLKKTINEAPEKTSKEKLENDEMSFEEYMNNHFKEASLPKKR